METVVLLHPGGTDSTAMVATAAGFEHRFRVLAPDRRHEAFPAMMRATVAFIEAEALEHTAELFRALPDAQLAIVPGTDHGSLVDKPELCNAIIAEFLSA